MGETYETFGAEWEKEMMKHSKKWLISQIKTEWATRGSLPFEDQKHPVLVGRMRDTKNIVIQCDGKYVEIPAENVRDVSVALLIAMQDPDEKG